MCLSCGYNSTSDNPRSTATARYLNDLWIFDTQEYKWTQVELKETNPRPSYVISHSFSRNLHDTDRPRSGFSFLPCADGVVLHGTFINFVNPAGCLTFSCAPRRILQRIR